MKDIEEVTIINKVVEGFVVGDKIGIKTKDYVVVVRVELLYVACEICDKELTRIGVGDTLTTIDAVLLADNGVRTLCVKAGVTGAVGSDDCESTMIF